jgi:hypothetical protein
MTFVDPVTKIPNVPNPQDLAAINGLENRMNERISTVSDSIESLSQKVDICNDKVKETQGLIGKFTESRCNSIGSFFARILRYIGLID